MGEKLIGPPCVDCSWFQVTFSTISLNEPG